MAWDNVWKEPRRELTEQAFGLIAFTPAFVGMVFIAAWLQSFSLDWALPPKAVETGAHLNMAWWLAYPIGFGIACFIEVILYAMWSEMIHDTGENVCNSMAKGGYDPRPKQRY